MTKIVLRNGNNLAGILNIEEEEPFTIETFATLIQSYSACNCALIIARVKTVSSDRHFYYNAHNLNKLLFRKYGKNNEYLFRLCVLNPLTNTEIQGDVEYYLISNTSARAIIGSAPPSLQHGKCPLYKSRSLHSVMPPPTTDDLKIAEIHLGHQPPSDQHMKQSEKVKKSQDSLIPRDSAVVYKLRDKSRKLLLDTDQNYLAQWPVDPKIAPPHIEATYIGTDDDFLKSPDLRDLFLLNAREKEDAELFEIPLSTLVQDGIIPRDLQTSLTLQSLGSHLSLVLGSDYNGHPDFAYDIQFIANTSLGDSLDSLGINTKRTAWVMIPICLVTGTTATLVGDEEGSKTLVYISLILGAVMTALLIVTTLRRVKIVDVGKLEDIA